MSRSVQLFLPISVAEFLAWYHHGELRFARSRLVRIPVVGNLPTSDTEFSCRLFARSPQVDHEEEQEILIIRMKPQSEWVSSTPSEMFEPEITYEPIANIAEIIPLTARAAGLLRTRLPPGIEMGAPVFETVWQQFLAKEVLRFACAGGRMLVSLTVGQDEPCTLSSRLEFEIEKGILARYFNESLDDHTGFVARSFCFSRQTVREGAVRPPSGSDLDYLSDFCVIANEAEGGARSATVEKFKNQFKDLRKLNAKKHGLGRLPAVLAEERVSAFLTEIQMERPDGFAASPVSVIIFLWLRDAFRSETYIDLAKLRRAVTELETVGSSDRRDALFLLGCFLGREAVAPYVFKGEQRGLKQGADAPVQAMVEPTESSAREERGEPSRSHEISEGNDGRHLTDHNIAMGELDPPEAGLTDVAENGVARASEIGRSSGRSSRPSEQEE